VPATDRRAIFVGAAAYEQAGGAIARDLFDEEGSGFFTDPSLLNRLAHEKLEQEAATVRAEGWKWVTAMVEYDHGFAADLRRTWPEFAELGEADQTRLDGLEAEHDEIANSGMDDDEEAAELSRIEAEIDRLRGPERYSPEDVATGGAFIFIGHDGKPRVERGYVRPEDESAEDGEASGNDAPASPPAEKAAPGLSEKLVADLTSHRTAGLRNTLAQSPDIALVAVIHALAAEAFFHGGGNCSCLQISLNSEYLSRHAPGIDESPLGHEINERHEQWAKRMPDDAAELWGFVAALADTDRLALLAHCASLAVNAVQAPGTRPASHAHADTLAMAVSLDMASWWRPTVANYLGRVSKDRILEAVREAIHEPAARSLAGMKKHAMAEAAEGMLRDTGWLPPPLRTAS
jgi:ParB family chromosome partitioning protein